jgi:glyoxylase-like metal-dependent hydrolase (beta-lactamase superfamily II)
MSPARSLTALDVIPFVHPQGCRTYLISDPESKEAIVVDPHLDAITVIARQIGMHGLSLRWILDTHTHADHPSGAGAFNRYAVATRVAHAKAGHDGVTHMPDDGETLALGDELVTVRHTPGHTPDHLVLVCDDVLFSGDSLFIGGVARTDFLGGDAGQLFDTLHEKLLTLDDDVVVYPGHDYGGKVLSTIGRERANNPWLQIEDRDEFARHLTANPPPEPANMAALLRLNRDGTRIPPVVSGAEAVETVRQGGAATVIDVRTLEEVQAAHIPGSIHAPLDQIHAHADEVRATPAPRLLLCRAGPRAQTARRMLAALGIDGMSVIDGGILEYAKAGGETAGGDPEAAAAGGTCSASPPPGTCSASPPPGTCSATAPPGDG